MCPAPVPEGENVLQDAPINVSSDAFGAGSGYAELLSDAFPLSWGKVGHP